ncbi:origin recognition complex subunit 2-like [Glandiceps talaboti]
MATSSDNHVRLKFVGDEDVVEHIQDIQSPGNYHLRKRKTKPKDHSLIIKAPHNNGGGDDEYDDESDSDMEVEPSSRNTLLEDTKVSGGDVFSFKTPKKSGKMAELAAQSKTPYSVKKKTQSKKLNLKSTPASQKKRPNKKTVKIKEETLKNGNTEKENTPYGLRRSRRQRIPVMDDSDTSPDDSDDADSDDSAELASVTFQEIQTPSTKKSSTTKTPSKTSSKKSTKGNLDMPVLAEEYFEAHSGAAVTSDRTLSRLNTPRMDQEQLNDVLKSAPSSHPAQCQSLYEDYRDLFSKWMFQLCNGFNLLLFGLGSKRVLIDELRQTVISDFIHIVINGFFPSITIKQILNSITEDALEHRGSFRSPIEQCEFIKKRLEVGQDDLFLIVHNIDGPMLRGDKAQSILSLLAQIPRVHLIASIDHINAPLVWDQTKSSRFNWLWYDVTSYEPYIEETSYENSLLVQQSGVLALSSLTHVMRSLPSNARGIFLLLAKYQLEQKDNSTYMGLSFQDLYQKCREAFLVNSDLTLRAQLTEFRDHKLIRFKTAIDGVQYLTIPIDAATLTEFLEEGET